MIALRSPFYGIDMQTIVPYAPGKSLRPILSSAGIHIGTANRWDIDIHDERMFDRILRDGTLGFGESYMDGWWDCDAIDELVYRLLSVGADRLIAGNTALVIETVRAKLFNLQAGSRSWEVGHRHYDLGNDLYTAMLDSRMVYTCAYWDGAASLDEAQERKLDLVCRKIGLRPGMRVLDIGCGFGSFAKFAAERYGAVVTGVTISKRQIELGRQLCRGLPVTLLLQDYRDIAGTYDRIVSLGMFEHVGHKNYRTFMKLAYGHLTDDGIFLLHTIGSLSGVGGDPWFSKYIFPNSELPTAAEIASAIENIFVMEDWHNFGADYDRTLMAWYRNFRSRWNGLKFAYGDRFYRMWRFYLLSCAGVFRARRNQLWQIVLTKNGMPGGYRSIR
jgi:cyclopropane-fatty-acyl-phospholipid synthase